MEDSELFKWLALISPVISGLLGGYITHLLTNRSKRLELLYEHKIPAFKEIHKILIFYKTHLDKTVADGYGSDFSPYENVESEGSLGTVEKLTQSFEINKIYLNKISRKAIEKLLEDMYMMCNIELQRGGGVLDDIKNIDEPYINMSNKLDAVIEILYKDLNLK